MNTKIKFNQWGWGTIQQPNKCFYFIQKMFDGTGNLFGLLVHYNDDENGTMEFVCTALVLDQALEKIKAHQKLLALKAKSNICRIEFVENKLTITGVEDYLVVDFDPIDNNLARISWNKHITKLIADFTTDCKFNTNSLLKEIAEL